MKDFLFGSKTYIMGILNVTPDSFSGDGIYRDAGKAVEQAARLKEEGADIIDVGGESTRPGAGQVDLDEEISRVIPVIERIVKEVDIPVSVDTRKSEVAIRALDKGAVMVNDISGMEADPDMARSVAGYGAYAVLMHIKGTPDTMQENPVYEDLLGEIRKKLFHLISMAEAAGIAEDRIIIDPGIGFGKTAENNLEILNNLYYFKTLRKPILVGTSRKSFIGKVLGAETRDRIFGTAASVSIAINKGADIIRVHDVKAMKQAAQVADAIVHAKEVMNA